MHLAPILACNASEILTKALKSCRLESYQLGKSPPWGNAFGKIIKNNTDKALQA